MRFVQPLDEPTKDALRQLARNSPDARLRQRAHAVLLSSKRYRIDQIADIFEVDRDTVSRWLDHWRDDGFEGLQDEARPGRPHKLDPDQEGHALLIALEEPRQIKLGLARIREQFDLRLSLDWLRRLLRRRRYRFKRLRASAKMKRDEAAFRQAQAELDRLKAEEASGAIDLYYFDEAGFALRPSLAYAWQPIGSRIEVEQTGRAQFNVLAFLSRSGRLVPFVSEEVIRSEGVIACIDAFAATLRRPTVVVLDNAPMHTSRALRACLPRWEQQGLVLKYLPSYSPELNLIEHLWRRMKYAWMPFSAYASRQALSQALEELLVGFGTKYHITFS